MSVEMRKRYPVSKETQIEFWSRSQIDPESIYHPETPEEIAIAERVFNKLVNIFNDPDLGTLDLVPFHEWDRILKDGIISEDQYHKLFEEWIKAGEN